MFTTFLTPSALLSGVGAAEGGSPFLTEVVGLFNIFVGLMVVAALLTYGIGFVVWITRLGSWPSPRDYAIEIMSWAPVILFVLIVLLAIVQFLQNHPQAGSYIVATVVLLLVVWAIVYLILNTRQSEKED